MYQLNPWQITEIIQITNFVFKHRYIHTCFRYYTTNVKGGKYYFYVYQTQRFVFDNTIVRLLNQREHAEPIIIVTELITDYETTP